MLEQFFQNFTSALDRERAAELAMLASGERLPEHYWQARHNAERKLKVAQAIADALRESEEWT